MNHLFERVAYLQGLADGMGLDGTTKEGKILNEIIEVLEDFAEAINELSDDIVDIDEYLEAIDSDLSDIEDDVYNDEFEDDDYDEIVCPECGETIFVDDESLYDDGCETEITCPNCDNVIVVSNECGCGCCDFDEDEE